MIFDPFKNRKKSWSGETVEQVKKKLLAHRKEVHDTYELAPFFDCAACGVLEHRLQRLEELKKEIQNG